MQLAFLRGLGRPVLAVPGNHDIPYTFPARFTRSFRAFERQWETTEPTYSSPTLHVIGLNSVRPWRHQSGGIRTAQLDARRGATACSAPADAYQHRRPAPPSDRCALALAQEAGRTPQPRSRIARGGGRRPDPRGPHPPGGGQREARVRDLARGRASESSSRSRRASASRGPSGRARRAASISTRSTRSASASRRTSGATRIGPSRPSGRSRAAVRPSSLNRPRPWPGVRRRPRVEPTDECNENHRDDDSDDERQAIHSR